MGAKQLLVGMLLFSLIAAGFYSLQSELLSSYGVANTDDYGSNLSSLNAVDTQVQAIQEPLKNAEMSDNTLSTLYYYTSAGVSILKATLGIPGIFGNLISDAMAKSGIPIPAYVSFILGLLVTLTLVFAAYKAIHKVDS